MNCILEGQHFHGKLYTVKYNDPNTQRPRNVSENRAQILSEEALGMKIKIEREQFGDCQRYKEGKQPAENIFVIIAQLIGGKRPADN